ncbi:MAG: multidrug effflux MFS transporter [Candidatus Comchoanobacterales bacterium]
MIKKTTMILFVGNVMSPFKLMFFVCLLGAITGVSYDMYAPSLEAIQASFGIDNTWSQMTMAIFMGGVAMSQLFYGAFSEGFGRKKAVLLGLSVMLLGSIGSLASSHIGVLIISRFIQGLGAGVGAALWRSIFRDGFKDEEMAKYGGYLVLFFLLVLPFAPILGSILSRFHWWYISLFLLVYNLAALWVVYRYFDETNAHVDANKWRMSYLVRSYYSFLVNKEFMSIGLSIFFTYGAFTSWFVVGSILITDKALLGLDHMYFSVASFAVSCSMMFLASMINNRYLKRVGPDRMLMTGWLLISSGGVLMVLLNGVIGLNYTSIIIAVSLLFFGSGFIFPNLFAGAMVPYAHMAGYAASLYSCIQMLGGFCSGSLLSYVPETSAFPMGIVMIIGGVVPMMVYWLGVIKNPKRHRLYEDQ